MNKQRGGSFTVSGWIALLAVACLAGSGVIGFLERQPLTLQCAATLQLSTTRIYASSDYYHIQSWPTRRNSCDVANTICYTRI